MTDDGSRRPGGGWELEMRFPSRRLTVHGVLWLVRLFVGTYDRRSRPDLIFESDGIVRRVRDYPENWHELPDDELFAVSYRR